MQILKFFIHNFIKEELSSIKYLYHGTSKGAALNIQKIGYIKPNRTGEEHPSISFTEKLDYAKHYANAKGGTNKAIILRTPLTNKFKLSDRIQNNNGDEYISFDSIPTNQLEVMTKLGWMPLNKWNVIFDEPLIKENSRADYLKWKRKNVTLRGMSDIGQENGGSAILGRGLYTAFLSNKSMAKGYGDVYFVVNAIPKNPKIFNTLNDWEIWFYNNLVYSYSKLKGKSFPDKRDFFESTTIENELQKLGYDGVVIKGREMVNYAPPDNVLYFRTEYELENYYNTVIAK